MPRWIGLLGSWALLVLGVGLLVFAVAAETINTRDAAQLRRVATIDELLREHFDQRISLLTMQTAVVEKDVSELQTRVKSTAAQIEELHDSQQTIVVSTAENKLYVIRDGQTVFETIVSTGKGTRLVENGRVTVFDTPVGKFRIRSKEKDPVWVPPDWHYIEEANKRGMRVVQLPSGGAIDANTGARVSSGSGSRWSLFGGGPVLKVSGSNVVVESGGSQRVLPKGELITAGRTVVIPPVGTEQRRFDRVLGTHRLNLGDGYALHGTQAVKQLGQSVSHGCVRLRNSDIEKLYEMSSVGDEVIIY
jgi:lipoprotein-anchoring transpeptidase ErfK/SrfK